MSSAPVTPFNVVYHVTTINHWEAILAEQMSAVLANRRVKSLRTTIAASSPALMAKAQGTIAAQVKGVFPCEFHATGFEEFEHPAMRVVERLAQQDDAPIMYFHMKGVSFSPPRPNREAGRRYLQKFVALGDRWASLLQSQPCDACGPLRMTDKAHGLTYFAGNTWMASAAYLRGLTPYDVFLKDPRLTGFVPGDRFLAELAVNRDGRMRSHAADGQDFVPETLGAFLWMLVPGTINAGSVPVVRGTTLSLRMPP